MEDEIVVVAEKGIKMQPEKETPLNPGRFLRS